MTRVRAKLVMPTSAVRVQRGSLEQEISLTYYAPASRLLKHDLVKYTYSSMVSPTAFTDGGKFVGHASLLESTMHSSTLVMARHNPVSSLAVDRE